MQGGDAYVDGGGRPSLSLVFLLGLLLPGLGHVYAGRIGRGGVNFALRFLVALPVQFGSLFLATTPLIAALVRFSVAPLHVCVATDGVIAVRHSPQHRWGVRRRLAITALSAVLGAGAAYVEFDLLRTRFVSIARVPTAAMRPTIEPGDLVLIDRRSSATQHLALGDVIVFTVSLDPKTEYLKRVAGLPGERVEVKHGCLLIDGSSRCREADDGDVEQANGKVYRIRGGADPPGDFGPVVVPDRCLFVLGDNRSQSADSRSWGFVPVDRVVGRMRHVVWSEPMEVGRDGKARSTWTAVRWERIGKTAFAE